METQKAFRLTVKDLIIDEPWYYENIIVYAKSHGEAKTRGIYEFESGKVEDYSQKDYKGRPHRDITFLDVRARRVKNLDKAFYRERWRTQQEIQQLEWQDTRDEKARLLTISNPNDLAVVYAGCYRQYWGANRSGYSDTVTFAGKYSTKEAYDIVRGSSYDRQEIVRLLDVEHFNSELNLKILAKEKEIERLKTYKL